MTAGGTGVPSMPTPSDRLLYTQIATELGELLEHVISRYSSSVDGIPERVCAATMQTGVARTPAKVYANELAEIHQQVLASLERAAWGLSEARTAMRRIPLPEGGAW